MHHGKSALFLSSAMVFAIASPALAQNAEPPERTNLIEELVVTAERREQSLQDVPVAVSAFTDERREVIGINTVQDLTNFTPGLSYATNTDRINVRGIGRFTNNRSSEGGVAQYIDGFYSSSVVSAGRSSIFLERTEVLRGPQGTLYGRNAIGGAINLISKRPEETFGGEVRASVGNYSLYNLEGMVTGPINDNLRFRLTGAYSDQNDGWFKNVAGGPDEGGRGEQWQIEAQLEGEIGDRFEWWVKYSTAEWDNLGRGPGGRSAQWIGDYETGPFVSGVAPNPMFGYIGGNPQNTEPRVFQTNTPNVITLEDVDFTWHATLRLDSFDIKYIGGHHYYDYRLQSDLDRSPRTAPYTLTSASVIGPGGATAAAFIPPGASVQVFPSYSNNYLEEVWWFSNELNFSSTNDSPFQWIAGLYQYREGSNYSLSNAKFLDQPEFANPITTSGTLAPPNPNRNYANTLTQNVNETYAAYGQVDYSFSDQWKVTAGLRYSLDKKQSAESARIICFLGGCPAALGPLRSTLRAIDISALIYAPGPGDPSVVVGPFTDPTTGRRHRVLEQDWSAWTGTLGVDWTPDEDTLVYAKYTRGYKAGGFEAGSLQQFPTTDKETIDAYEVGAKRTFGGVFQANASAYYYGYNDIQVPLTGTNPVTNLTQTLFFNLPKSRIIGFELETIWRPINNLDILANYSYLNAKITDACCFADPQDPFGLVPGAAPVGAPTATGVVQDLDGQRLPASTPHRFTVNGAYTWDFDAGSLIGSLSYVWRDDTYYGVFNRYYNKAKAFEQVDARFIWNDAADRFTIIAYAKNIFDVNGSAGVSATRQASTNRVYQDISLVPPRTYGVEFQYRF